MSKTTSFTAANAHNFMDAVRECERKAAKAHQSEMIKMINSYWPLRDLLHSLSDAAEAGEFSCHSNFDELISAVRRVLKETDL